MLAYTVPQDRAMSTQPWRRCTTREEIELGIPPRRVRAAPGRRSLTRRRGALVGNAPAVCFRVPAVAFRLRAEQHDAW